MERKKWTPPASKFAADEIVPVKIAYAETANKEMARVAGGRWDPNARAWLIPFGEIKDTALEKHIILDALKSGKKRKAYNIRCFAGI